MLRTYTSTPVDGRRLTTDLSSDLAQITQWSKNWLITFNASKKQTTTDRTPTYHQSRWRAAPLRRHRVLKEYLASNSNLTSSWTRNYDPLLRTQVKWWVPCTYPVSSWLFLLTSTPNKSQNRPQLERLRALVGDELFPKLSLPEAGRGKPLTALPLLPRKMLGRTTFPGPAKANLHGLDRPC